MSARRASDHRQFIERMGRRCAFPGCATPVAIVEVAHIYALRPDGPRYSERAHDDFNNLILLCPSHHALVDSRPAEYTVNRLVHMREMALESQREYVREVAVGEPQQEGSLATILRRWRAEESNADEEFWQTFFAAHPVCFATALNGRSYALQSKCYVGGKKLDNRGGTVLDFLATYVNNAACIEIKTPATPLMGARYRNSVYSPGKDLAGGVVQVLQSKTALIRNLAILGRQDLDVTAIDPACFLIIGRLSTVSEEAVESFELYRRSLKDVAVITYDEIFESVAMLAGLN